LFSLAGFRRRQAAEKQEQLADILAGYSSSGLPTPDDDDEDEEGEADEEDGEPEDHQSAEEECTSPRRRRRRRPGGSVFSLEPSWADVVRDAAALDKRQRDYQEAVWELLATELQHIDKLRVVVDVRHHTNLTPRTGACSRHFLGEEGRWIPPPLRKMPGINIGAEIFTQTHIILC